MGDRKGVLWYLVNGAMELSWFLAWAMFLSQLTLHRPFPFFETIAAFAWGAFVTRLSTGKGWRVVSVLGIRALGFIGAALLLIHGIDYSSDALWESGWLVAFFDASRDVWEWLILTLNLFQIAILWKLGAVLVRRPTAHRAACNRFDLGLGAFFALFIIKLIALTKGEAMTEDVLSWLFIFPFFLFGLLSIGMARMQSAAAKAFLPGYRGIGAILSFFAAVLLGTGGLLLFFLPGLTAAAQTGYRALSFLGKPLGPVLIAILRFVFGPRANDAAAVAMRSAPMADLDGIAPQAHSWWMVWLEKVLGWTLLGLLSVVMAVAAAVALFYGVKWLLSRTQGDRLPSTPISARLAAWRVIWAKFRRRFLRGVTGYPRAAELYGVLVGWAGRSGSPQDRGDTPLEFGRRLNSRFPALRPPIDLIIGAYNREVYGETTLNGATLAAANSAWKFLRSPLRWPARLKGWIAGSPTEC